MVYGAINPDLVHIVDGIPGPGDDIRSSEWMLTWGGKACNAAMALAGWGATTKLLGLPIGRDPLGAALLDAIDVPHLDAGWIERTDESTRHCVILLTPDGERTIVCAGYAGAAWQDVPTDAWAGVVGLLLDGFAADQAVAAAAAAASQSIPTVWLDAPDPPPVAVDLVVWSRHEHSPDAASRVASTGSPVALTAGAAPVVLFWGSDVRSYQPPPVAAVDTTGSGDVFAAGCVYGLALGWGLAAAVEFGCAAGSAAAARPRRDRAGLQDVAALFRN